MNALRKLTLGYRFGLLIGCVVLGFVIYGAWSFKTLNDLKVNGPTYQRIVQGKDIVADILPPPEYIIESYLVTLQLFANEMSDKNSGIERLKTLKAEYDTRHAFWENQRLSDALALPLLKKAHVPAIAFYTTLFDDFVPAIQVGDQQKAAAAMAKLKTSYELHRAAIDEVVTIANNRVKSDETMASQQIITDTLLMLVVLVIAILLTAGIAAMISNSVSAPLVALQRMILGIKNSKDFSVRLAVESDDEVAQTANSFNELIQSIQATLLTLLDSAQQVSYAAHELSASSQQVAVSSGQQSSAANDIAASVERVNASINHVTQNARQALDISNQSGNLSNHGGDIIHNAATAMMQIAEAVQETSSTIEVLGQQSKQISSVVQVIKDVADQTNLLALNAAIEAARAGEQGRGFAVVADEVRNLAKRTTKATEEISQMIATMQTSASNAIVAMTSAVDKADNGAVIAHQAGEAINQIKLGSAQVVEVVNTISNLLSEQNKASNDISSNIEHVAQMAEENNAAVRQTASAAVQLAALALEMRSAVSQFKL